MESQSICLKYGRKKVNIVLDALMIRRDDIREYILDTAADVL